MARAKLSDIVDMLEAQPEGFRAYLDCTTGEVISISDEDAAAVEGGDLDKDAPAWQKQVWEEASAVVVNVNGRFLALPDRFELKDSRMLARFADSLEDQVAATSIRIAIDGPGAFRHFKQTVANLGLTDRWYKFRDGQYRAIARAWCEENGVEALES